MIKRLILVSTSALAMAAGQASAAAVNFGNLTVYNNPLTIIPFSPPIGGTYTKFVFTTNWSFGYGGAISYLAQWNIGNPVSPIIASLTSISGMAYNGNTTSITVAGTLSVGVTNASALQFIASQNNSAIGSFTVQGFWSNAVLNFYVAKPLPPIPSGIANIGIISPSSAQRVTVTTGGTTFNPEIALYGQDGYLLGTNGGGGTVGGGGTGLQDMTLASGVYYLFAAGTGATFGPEDLAVSVPQDAPGGAFAGTVNGVPFPNPVVEPGQGQWYSFTVAPPACVGDITGDGHTNVADFNVLAGHFGQQVFPPYTNGDLNGDALVNVADFNLLAGNFGCTH